MLLFLLLPPLCWGSTIEGDIILDPGMQASPMLSAALANPERLWPGGRIIYTFDDDFSEANRRMVRKAMEYMSMMNPCLSFKEVIERTGDFVRIYNGLTCSSQLGRLGGEQRLSLNTGCLKDIRTAVHELCHTLGFLHEHTRPDRETWVEIVEANILEERRKNFIRQDRAFSEDFDSKYDAETSLDTKFTPYDVDSVLHYGPLDFSRNGERTINYRYSGLEDWPAQPPQDPLTVIDRVEIALTYRDEAGCTVNSSEIIQYVNMNRMMNRLKIDHNEKEIIRLSLENKKNQADIESLKDQLKADVKAELMAEIRAEMMLMVNEKAVESEVAFTQAMGKKADSSTVHQLYATVVRHHEVKIEGKVACSNQCSGKSEDWCGERRRRGDTLLRCTERTREGCACLTSCNKTDPTDHSFCNIAVGSSGVGNCQWASGQWARQCGLEGLTTLGAACTGPCGTAGENYWWCRTGVEGEDSWGRCSPPGQVTVVQYAVNGQECLDECAQRGVDYWWCHKPSRWDTMTDTDAAWDYCSLPKLTKSNLTCLDECASRGEAYFWCHTQGNSWDKCSPAITQVEPVMSKSGWQCFGVCDFFSETYKYCTVQDGGNHWDYC